MRHTNRRRLCGILCIAALLAGILLRDAKGQRETAVRTNGSGEAAVKRVALTFDDGPGVYTKELLDGLRARGVRATFFLLGENIELHEDVVRQMYRDGHLLGNHTYSHVQLSKLSKAAAKSEVEKTSNRIYELTGYYPVFVRPPFGDWRKDLEYAVTMLPVLWTVDPLDWQFQNTDEIVRRVERCAGAEDIILLHDTFETSVRAALRIVDDLQKDGCRFVTVEELVLE